MRRGRDGGSSERKGVVKINLTNVISVYLIKDNIIYLLQQNEIRSHMGWNDWEWSVTGEGCVVTIGNSAVRSESFSKSQEAKNYFSQ